MIIKATTQDRAEHNSVLCKSCHKHPKKQSAYDSAYGITAQKCRSAYDSAYDPPLKCLRQCLHYYIVTISNTIVGTLNKLYKKLERLCRPFRIFHLVFICKEGRE